MWKALSNPKEYIYISLFECNTEDKLLLENNGILYNYIDTFVFITIYL